MYQESGVSKIFIRFSLMFIGFSLIVIVIDFHQIWYIRTLGTSVVKCIRSLTEVWYIRLIFIEFHRFSLDLLHSTSWNVSGRMYQISWILIYFHEFSSDLIHSTTWNVSGRTYQISRIFIDFHQIWYIRPLGTSVVECIRFHASDTFDHLERSGRMYQKAAGSLIHSTYFHWFS